MKFVLVALATSAAILMAQVQSSVASSPVQVAPHPAIAAPNLSGVSAPVLGYLARGEGAEVYAVVGSASRPKMGAAVLRCPANATRIRFAPGQQYALVEKSVEDSMTLWVLKRSAAAEEVPLRGVMSHADLVAFSPTGEAAVLFSRADKRLQVLTDLPGRAKILREFSAGERGQLSSFAVSDDGSLLVAAFGDEIPKYSLDGAAWQFISTAYKVQAWLFLPRTRDLVLSDLARKEVVLLSGLSGSSVVARVLADSVSADYIAATRDGQRVLAGSSADNSVFDIQLTSGLISRVRLTQRLNSLIPLRDGHTFLLASDPVVSLLDAAALPADQFSLRIGSPLHSIQLSH